MNDRIGFECTQVLMQCDTKAELDEAIRIVNNFYRIFSERLETLDDIRERGHSAGLWVFEK